MVCRRGVIYPLRQGALVETVVGERGLQVRAWWPGEGVQNFECHGWHSQAYREVFKAVLNTLPWLPRLRLEALNPRPGVLGPGIHATASLVGGSWCALFRS